MATREEIEAAAHAIFAWRYRDIRRPRPDVDPVSYCQEEARVALEAAEHVRDATPDPATREVLPP